MTESAPPLRRDAERNRQRILTAAAKLVATRGLDVGYDEIARAADVGVGTVYRRFPTRVELFRELFQDRIEAAAALAEEALGVEDPWDGLRQFLERDFELQSSDRGLRQFLLGGPPGIELGVSAGDRLRPVLKRLVKRAQEAGSLRSDVGERDFAIILALVGSLMDATLHVDPELWRRYLAILLEGLHQDSLGALPGSVPALPALKEILSSWVPPTRR